MHFNYDKEARSFEDVCAIYAGEKMGKYKVENLSQGENGSMEQKEGDTSITVSYVKNYSGLQRFGRLLQGLAYTLCTVFVGLGDLRLRHKFEAAFAGKVTKVVRCDSDAYTKAEKILKSFQSRLQPASHQKIEENEEEPQIEVEVVRYTESRGETDSEKHCKSIFEAEKMLRGGKTDEAIAELKGIESWNLPPTLKSLGLGVVGEAKRQKLALELLPLIILNKPVGLDNPKRSDYIARSDDLRRLLEKALEADPQNAKASASLGASLLQQNFIARTNRLQKALGYLKDALAMNPDDPEVGVWLALVDLRVKSNRWFESDRNRGLREMKDDRVIRKALESFESSNRSQKHDITIKAILPADIKIAMLSYFLHDFSCSHRPSLDPAVYSATKFSPPPVDGLEDAVLEDMKKIEMENPDQAIEVILELGNIMGLPPEKKAKFLSQALAIRDGNRDIISEASKNNCDTASNWLDKYEKRTKK